ncbi:hypothetical protein OS493_008390 [Desmophyllum pertusum]|uniref:Uncharacterized protein n=1 Tax=Desmophyllum pertusum TaxID=174260 RepID=A0A9X0A466_9CNID|nr:hypothetical protein OS493_008390 [Desmophyllum pertusum]
MKHSSRGLYFDMHFFNSSLNTRKKIEDKQQFPIASIQLITLPRGNCFSSAYKRQFELPLNNRGQNKTEGGKNQKQLLVENKCPFFFQIRCLQFTNLRKRKESHHTLLEEPDVSREARKYETSARRLPPDSC